MTWQAAAAHRFSSIVDHNFGFGGEDRPTEWPPLTSKYAKEFHGGNRIPALILSGELQSSIQVQDSNIQFSEVFTDNEYAESHQYGEGRLPARPFFPIVGDRLTDYAASEVQKSANSEVEKLISSIGSI